MHVVFVVQSPPDSVGHGSNHRAYQVAHDLAQIAGEDGVTVFEYAAEAQAQTRDAERPAGRALRTRFAHLPLPWQERLRRVRMEFRNLRTGGRVLLREQRRLVSLFLGGPSGEEPPPANRTLRRYDDPRVLARYRDRVRSLPRPLVCVVRHSAFARLAWTNRSLGIPTVACPANLEALDQAETGPGCRRRALYRTVLDLGDELGALAACDARLFISRVETGLVNGLCFPSHYYPYRPVGAIRENMLAVRRRRLDGEPRPGLFVMPGSADHPTTKASFRRFLREAAEQGVPAGVRLVLCGRATESLTAGARIPGVEARGWVPQHELHTLLASAQGALLPQETGFGGLTRLAELSCAIVPVLVSAHATHAVQPMPPGIQAVGDRWTDWLAGMRRLAEEPMDATIAAREYEAWEESQTAPLPRILAGLAY